jgi:hypothetical protein
VFTMVNRMIVGQSSHKSTQECHLKGKPQWRDRGLISFLDSVLVWDWEYHKIR